MLVSIIFTCHSQKEQAHSILRMAHKTKRCSRGRWQTLITARHPLATDGLNNTWKKNIAIHTSKRGQDMDWIKCISYRKRNNSWRFAIMEGGG
uniref:Uncharacterized protein n=1 Tax=Aegilops tauschii subsp. strangulata TaxID=200361 RepID=A0A453KMJ8_AEGTS